MTEMEISKILILVKYNIIHKNTFPCLFLMFDPPYNKFLDKENFSYY